MATISISRKDGGTGPVATTAPVTLVADVSPAEVKSRATPPSWCLDTAVASGPPGWQKTFTPSGDTNGDYTASTTVDGQTITSEPLTIALAGSLPDEDPANGGGATGDKATELPVVFHGAFASITAVLVLVVALIVLDPIRRGVSSFHLEWRQR